MGLANGVDLVRDTLRAIQGRGVVTMSRTLRADENKGDGLARTCATGGMLSSLSSSFAW